MKYLDKNLTKYVQSVYKKNYKTLMKELKELNKWKDIPCSKRKTQNCQNVSSSQNDM